MPVAATISARPAPSKMNEGVSALLAGADPLTIAGVGSGVSSGTTTGVASILGGNGVKVGNG